MAGLRPRQHRRGQDNQRIRLGAPRHARPKLLVLDDDAALRDCFRELLGDAYEILEAADGESGLRLARAARPDMVLLDLRLPDISGLDVLSELRGLDPTLPIVVVTAVTGAQSAVEAMKRGATDYVTKPFQHDELPDLLQRALNRRTPTGDAGEQSVSPIRLLRILLMSPHRGRRVVLSVLLRRYGPVVPAATVQEARAAVPEEQLGLVVVDDHGGLDAPPDSDEILRVLGVDAPVVRLGGGQGKATDASAVPPSLGALVDAARRSLGGVAADLRPVSAGLTRALEYVASHYASRLTVHTLAQEAGLSESHFAHVFHEDTGMSVRRVLRRIRVEIAKEMLAEGQASLGEIARSAGFVDGSHLSRAFRAETGLSLRGFRLAVDRAG